jgi:hypothetical protein
MSTLLPEGLESQSADAPVFQSPAGGLIVYRVSEQNSGCSAVNRPLIKAINRNSKQVVLFHPRCKSWRCPGCAKINAQKVVLRAVNGSEVLRSQGAAIDFVTITSHEKLDPAASLAVLPLAWAKLNRRIKRAAQSPEYFAIPEQHSDGRWHLHAMTTARLPKKWWKDNARSCGLGYQSDVQEVKSLGGVAYYVGKYVAKELKNTNLPTHFRRVRPSQGWPELPAMKPLEGWEFLPVDAHVPMQHETDVYQRMGYTVVLADEKSSWDWIENFA